MKEAAKPTSERRKPVQARSKRRYEAILDAAAVLFDTEGFEATSMDAIAQRAGTSIGSVYQFFSNKREIFIAIAERCIERTRVLFHEAMSGDALARPFPELLETVVDIFIETARTDPDLRALNANLHLYGLIEQMDVALLRDLALGVGAAVGIFAPQLSEGHRRAIGETVVQTVNAFLFFAHRLSTEEAEANLTEMKRMLSAYLQTYMK